MLRTTVRRFVRGFSTTTSTSSAHRDVVCVGGGIVGATFAAALGQSPTTQHLRVSVLEPFPPPPSSEVASREAPGIRVSALTHRTKRIFEEIGVWDAMKAIRVSPYKKMEVWDTFSRGRVSFDVDEMRTQRSHDFDALGYVVENDVMQSVLFEKLQELSTDPSCNLDIIPRSKVRSFPNVGSPSSTHPTEGLAGASSSSHKDDSIDIDLDSGQKLTTRLVVGSDGAMSIVKRAFGFSATGWDYNQRGVVATVQHSEANVTAFQRYLPDGPVAFLPCHDNYSSIVWSTTPEHAKHLCSIPDEIFLEDLNSAFRAKPEQFTEDGNRPSFSNILPEQFSSLLPVLFPPPSEACPPEATKVIGKRAAFPLRLIHTEAYTKPRVALIGGAAALGVNLLVYVKYKRSGETFLVEHLLRKLLVFTMPRFGDGTFEDGVNLGIGAAADLAKVFCEVSQLGFSDAAHVVHPMAGQGVNLGIGDAAELARVIAEATQLGLDSGDVSILELYENSRKANNIAVLGGVDSIKRLFGVSSGPVALARNIGADVVNSVPFIKDQMALFGMDVNRTSLV